MQHKYNLRVQEPEKILNFHATEFVLQTGLVTAAHKICKADSSHDNYSATGLNSKNIETLWQRNTWKLHEIEKKTKKPKVLRRESANSQAISRAVLRFEITIMITNKNI